MAGSKVVETILGILVLLIVAAVVTSIPELRRSIRMHGM